MQTTKSNPHFCLKICLSLSLNFICQLFHSDERRWNKNSNKNHLLFSAIKKNRNEFAWSVFSVYIGNDWHKRAATAAVSGCHRPSATVNWLKIDYSNAFLVDGVRQRAQHSRYIAREKETNGGDDVRFIHLALTAWLIRLHKKLREKKKNCSVRNGVK